MSKIKFDPSYKQSIRDAFIADYLSGYMDKHLGDKFFHGHCYVANHFVRDLKDVGLLEKGPRPRPENAPHPADTIEPCAASLELSTPSADLYRQSALHKHQFLREKNRTDALVAFIRESITPLPPQLPPVFGPRSASRRVVKLLLSDWQPGMLVEPSDTYGIETYNTDVFFARGRRLIAAVEREVRMIESLDAIDAFEIDFLGDGPEGETIFPAQGIYTDSPTIDQLMNCRAMMAEILTWACSRFPRVRYRHVRGNHGRPGMKGANHQRTNWDDVLGEFVKADFRDQSNLEVYISKSDAMAYAIPELPGMNFVSVHGQHLQKRDLRKMRDQFAGLLNIPVNYLFFAHFHNVTMEDVSHGGVVVNGAFSGGNSHSTDHLRVANAPKQLMLTFSAAEGLKSRHDLYLDGRRQPRIEADANGIYTPVYA